MRKMKKVCEKAHNHISHFIITDAFCNLSLSHSLSLLSSISLSLSECEPTRCMHPYLMLALSVAVWQKVVKKNAECIIAEEEEEEEEEEEKGTSLHSVVLFHHHFNNLS